MPSSTTINRPTHDELFSPSDPSDTDLDVGPIDVESYADMLDWIDLNYNGVG